MKKKLSVLIILGLVTALSISGCRIKKAEVKEPVKEEIEKAELEEEEVAEAEAKELPPVPLTSEKDILNFIKGEWTYIDPHSSEMLGNLMIKEDGSVSFTRLRDSATVEGSIAFNNFRTDPSEEPDEFTLTLKDVSLFVPEGVFAEPYDEEMTSGSFRVGRSRGEDYFYLQELGNGGSAIAYYVFNDHELDPEGEDMTEEWLLVRRNDLDDKDSFDRITDIDSDTFFAWIWKYNGKDSVNLQLMDAHEYDTFEDYSNRKFMGAYFNEKNIDVLNCALSDKVNDEDVYDSARLNREYPIGMYEITVDGDGVITKIKDVDSSFYGVYDLGSLPTEFSYEGNIVTINGAKIDMTEYVPSSKYVKRCTDSGNWIIIDCYVDDKTDVYEFYNVNSGFTSFFDYEITGRNLTFENDKLYAALYIKDDVYYDFWGNYVGEDALGYEAHDEEVLSYFEYCLGGAREWRKFMSKAPDNALAFIMINPPQAILDKIRFFAPEDVGDKDSMVVVSLVDDLKVTVDNPDTDFTQFWTLDKGQAELFLVRVSESLPIDTLTVSKEGTGEAKWGITMLSGRIPQISKFIVYE